MPSYLRIFGCSLLVWFLSCQKPSSKQENILTAIERPEAISQNSNKTTNEETLENPAEDDLSNGAHEAASEDISSIEEISNIENFLQQEAPQEAFALTSRSSIEEHVIMDFDDKVLHDSAWLEKQAAKSSFTFVGPKGDSGADKLSLAVGEGINGSNALLVESTSKEMGLPGFWVMRGKSKPGNIYDKSGYLLPSGKRANQVEFWLRFQPNFRKTRTSSPKIIYPNHQNLHFGTYHFDPSLIGMRTPVKESHNWHFYHQIYLRNDKAQEKWIRVVLNEAPQHQRSLGGLPGINPTAPHGNYFEIMTRFYIDCTPYFSDPEIEYPVKMWVDNIKFRYAPPRLKLGVTIDGYENGDLAILKAGIATEYTATATNEETKPLAVRIAPRAAESVKVEILNAETKIPVKNTTLPARSKTKLILRITPKGARGGIDAGLSIVVLDRIKSDATSNHRSITSDFVENRWGNVSGPHDSDAVGAFLSLKVE